LNIVAVVTKVSGKGGLADDVHVLLLLVHVNRGKRFLRHCFKIEKMRRDIPRKSSKMEASSSLLGRGSFGTVYRQGNFAVKSMAVDAVVENWEEIDILTRLSHPALCTATNVSLCQTRVATAREWPKTQLKITMPLADCHLKQYVKNKKPSLSSLLHIWRDLLSGLSFLHSSGYLHLDIKPSNILLRGQTAMLADFGLAKAMFPGWDRASSFTRITYTYRPPENFTVDEYDTWSDIWSLGMTMLVTLNEGKEILTSGCTKKQVQKFTEGCFGSPDARKRTISFYLCRTFPDVDKETKNAVVSLLSSMLNTDHHSRPSAKFLLNSLQRRLQHEVATPSAISSPQAQLDSQNLDCIRFCSKSHGRALYRLLRRVLSEGVIRIRTFVSTVQLYYAVVSRAVEEQQRALCVFVHESDLEKRVSILTNIAMACYNIQDSIHEEGTKSIPTNTFQPIVERFLCQHLCSESEQRLSLVLDPRLDKAFCTTCFSTLWKRFLHLFSPRYFEKLQSDVSGQECCRDIARDDGSSPTMKVKYSLNNLFFHKDAEPYKKRLQKLA
jgi:hypothetical protein